MHDPAASARPEGLGAMARWPRLRFTLLFSCTVGLLLGASSGLLPMLFRAVLLGLSLMLVFGIFEQWPRRLPSWLERWVLQVIAVAVAVPLAAALIFAFTRPPGGPAFYHERDSMRAFSSLTMLALFLAPWTALGALVRQKEALARHQALAFQLERSELERQALEARLKLLQAQIAPHFLFNTLANVQALVDAGSPQASAVLRNLIAYLRAAVPRLGEPATTLGDELDLVRAYLELMQMRMPDRLQFALQVDAAARTLRCPPMTLLTLVENAVRHGVDPNEQGGRIDVQVCLSGARCLVRISDSGAGLRPAEVGLGTGLLSLRERLRLAFGDDAQLRVSALQPQGVCAELDLPAALRER
jgi:glucose-6-phosphate-specific signal transduction histidine kinase